MKKVINFKKPVAFGIFHGKFREVLEKKYESVEKKYFHTQLLVPLHSSAQKDLIQKFIDKNPFYANGSYIQLSENKRVITYLTTCRAGLYLCCDSERRFIDNRPINSNLMIDSLLVDTFVNPMYLTDPNESFVTGFLQGFLLSVADEAIKELEA